MKTEEKLKKTTEELSEANDLSDLKHFFHSMQHNTQNNIRDTNIRDTNNQNNIRVEYQDCDICLEMSFNFVFLKADWLTNQRVDLFETRDFRRYLYTTKIGGDKSLWPEFEKSIVFNNYFSKFKKTLRIF